MPSQHGLSHSFSIFHHDRNVEDQLFGITFIDSQSSYIREPMRQILFIQQLNGKRKKLRSCASFFPWQHSYLSSSKFAPIWFYIPNFPRFNSDPHGTTSSTSSGESAPSTTLASTSSSSFTSSPSSVAISAETLSFPKLFSSRSLRCWRLFGRTERQFFQQQVWQFQRGFFRDKCAVDSNIDLDWLSLIFFSR